ncbi:GH36-type glycosyl hydrolase domain-containing protein [Treponema sp. R6D11]
MFDGAYGEFSENGKEYIIYNPPPRPWCNILANDTFGCIMKDNGPSFSWAENSQLFKLTPHTGDYLEDFSPEELVFLDSGESLFSGICTHGLGYTTYKGDGFFLTAFVPKNGNRKIYIVELDVMRDVRFAVSPCMGDKPNPRHIETEFLGNALVFQNNFNIDFSHLEMYITSNEPCRVDDGIVVKAKNFVIELGVAPKGQSKGLTLLEAKEQLEIVKNYWQEMLPKKETGEQDVDVFLSYWLPYQTISSRIFARTGYYQVSGAYGFRDQLQDCMNILNFSNDFLKNQILSSCRHQYVEGDVQHWWHKIPNDDFHPHKGVRTRITDDRLWLPLAVAEYIEKTGDRTILNETVPYIESPMLGEAEAERYETPKTSERVGSVLEHCIKAIKVSLSFGSHGLPLIGGGDWNDGFSCVGIKGKGESVWLGWFLIYVIKKFKDFADYTGVLPDLINSCNSAWDGNWFLRGYYDNGSPLGSKACDECKIDSISQSFAVISGGGSGDKLMLSMQSAEEYLVLKEEKIIKLLTPAFQNTKENAGYIKGYLAGVRENGGQYTHAAAWFVWALAKMGEIDKAKELWKMLLPIGREENYGLEPYAVAADIYSGLDNTGVGGWSWYSGAAGWLYRIGLDIWGLA